VWAELASAMSPVCQDGSLIRLNNIHDMEIETENDGFDEAQIYVGVVGREIPP